MSYTDEVNDRINFTRQAALREGEMVVPGFEGEVASSVLLDVLEDDTVIRETVTEIKESDANDLEREDVVAVFAALKRVLAGGR